MKLRHLKRRHDAGTGRQARIRAIWLFNDGEDHYFHDDDGEVRNVTCQHCSGTGGDPWNDGITPCEHCDGEGYEWWQ